MTITELLESWKGRAEKAEAELARVQRELDHKKMWANEIAACAKEELEKAHKEIERVQLERDHYKNKVERYREVLGANTNESICEAAERVQAAAAEVREALLKRLPSLGAWENDCVLCGAHTDCGDIPHKPDCPFVIAQNSSAGTGYIRKEDVVPLVEFAQSVARSMPADSNIHRRAKEALAYAKTKGLTE